MQRTKKATLWGVALASMALVAGLATSAGAFASSGDEDRSASADEAAESGEPQADEFGVITADQWAEVYPNEYESYLENEENSPDSGKHNYLELYPALNTMYKGYGFSKGYDEASSHLYTLESIKATPRVGEATLANCITCKTPQFTALVNSEGDEVYAQSFSELIDEFDEPISCYNCHENDPETLTVASKFWNDSMGDDADEVPLASQVCGQCHNEYYFDGETKVPTNPYSGTDAMTPDAILAYYDEAGYSDWTHPDTGAAMIKVQHPEFETNYCGEGSVMTQLGYTCADCHMATTTDDEGNEYSSHNWTSPLENEELIANDCSTCHEDLVSEVREIQEASEERVTSISEKIEDMINQTAEQIAAGTIDDDTLAEVQSLHRTAQFYWDFVMVENSEGAHNPTLADETLDKAEAAVDEALELLAS